MGAYRISVVIPTYNARATIDDAIESVLEQTFPAHEVWVVDDGSQDGTASWVREHFPTVQVLEQSNSGPSAARNRGISAADGNWTAFLDADDRWHPEKLARQVKVLEAHPDAVLVASDWVRWAGAFPDMPSAPPVTRLAKEDIVVLNRFQTSTVVMRTEVARQLGGFDSAVDGAEDWDFWLRAAGMGGVVKLNQPLVMYRDVAEGYSKDVWRVYVTALKMLDRERSGLKNGAVILAWHHLRFWVAFRMAGDREHATRVLQNLKAARLWGAVPSASLRYLLPFLGRRVLRRVVR